MSFQPIDNSNVQVRLNYGQADLCDGCGPFMWIRSKSNQISPIIDPEELIRLMRPPLKF
jgi:hypothetical protein